MQIHIEKLRNTFRYLLGNLNDEFKYIDFNKLNLKDLPELEQYMLHKVYHLNKNFKKYFSNYMIFIIFTKNY